MDREVQTAIPTDDVDTTDLGNCIELHSRGDLSVLFDPLRVGIRRRSRLIETSGRPWGISKGSASHGVQNRTLRWPPSEIWHSPVPPPGIPTSVLLSVKWQRALPPRFPWSPTTTRPS